MIEPRRRAVFGLGDRLLARIEEQGGGLLAFPMKALAKSDEFVLGILRKEAMGWRLVPVDKKARTVVVRDRKHPQDRLGNDQVVPLLRDAGEPIDDRLAGDLGAGAVEEHPSVCSLSGERGAEPVTKGLQVRGRAGGGQATRRRSD